MFLKPNTIVYLRRNSLLIAGKHVKPARLTFPANATANLEVINADIFGQLCLDFFRDNHLKGLRVLLVLDHGVVFTKITPLDKHVKSNQLVKDFVSIMPFEPGLRVCLNLKTNDSVQLFATNPEFYEVVVDALHDAGAAKVVAITPIAAYGARETDQLSSAIVDQLLRDTAVRAKVDFHGAEAV